MLPAIAPDRGDLPLAPDRGDLPLARPSRSGGLPAAGPFTHHRLPNIWLMHVAAASRSPARAAAQPRHPLWMVSRQSRTHDRRRSMRRP
jgi:hypothetical protein